MADKGHDTYTEPQPLNVPSFTRNDLEDTHVDGSSTPFDHTANPETASHTPVPEVALTGRVEQSHQTVDNTLNANPPPESLPLTAVSQHNDSRSSPPPGVPKRGRKLKEVLAHFKKAASFIGGIVTAIYELIQLVACVDSGNGE